MFNKKKWHYIIKKIFINEIILIINLKILLLSVIIIKEHPIDKGSFIKKINSENMNSDKIFKCWCNTPRKKLIETP